MPTLLAKVTNLLNNISLDQCEEPQIVRYRKGEEFSWHYDEVPASQLVNGGQRIATALVYLNDVNGGSGGSTTNQQQLSMTPKQGSLLLFFPAFANGSPDERTLHKGEQVDGNNTKMVVQMWIHQRQYVPVLPKGNSHDDAREAIQAKEVELGLRTTS
jgi:prolyl 4-hydroxylase